MSMNRAFLPDNEKFTARPPVGSPLLFSEFAFQFILFIPSESRFYGLID
jgi:hypothetical protein